MRLRRFGFLLLLLPAADLHALAASYSLTTYNCGSLTYCATPAPARQGVWSAAASDRAETETGTPFDIGTASGMAFYGKSIVTIQGGSMTLSNHIQMANFQKWTTASGRTNYMGPACAWGNITDTLTIAGAEGDAYFLPVYEVEGKFASSSEKYLQSYVALCPTTGRACGPMIRRSPGGVSNVQVTLQSSPGDTLRFHFGVPFQYKLEFYSRVLPPTTPAADTSPGTFHDDEAVDFTIRLTGVAITDRSGRAIPGAKVLSEAGIAYQIVPPPAAPAQPQTAAVAGGFVEGAQPQTAAATSGIVEGDVVNAATNAPVAGARVKLNQGDEPTYTKADAQGHFVFRDLRPGYYTLAVESPGFLRPRSAAVDLTAPRPNGMGGGMGGAVYDYSPSQAPEATVTKSMDADGTVRASVKVPLMAYAAIGGKVTDPYGMPMVDVRIQILTRTPPRPQGMPVTTGRQGEYTVMASVATDDRGEFRAGRLEPGSYWVMANKGSSARSTWLGSYRATYYPAALDMASAKPLTLAAGQEARADIKLLNQIGVRVSGRLIRPGSPANANAMLFTRVVLTPPNYGPLNQDAPFTIGQDDFELRGVLPGKYTLLALTEDGSTDLTGPNRKRMYGLMKEVAIGPQDMEGFDLALEPLQDLAGTVEFRQGCAAAPVTVRLQGPYLLAPWGLEATTDSSGRFVLRDVPPGKFSVGITGQPNPRSMARVSSIGRGSRDVLQDGLEAPIHGDEVLKIAMDCGTQGRRP